MKQHILPKQALEMSEYQFYKLFNPNEIVPRTDWFSYHHKKVTIGKMIEFLNDNNWNIDITKIGKDFRVANNKLDGCAYSRYDLCDALWEAVKRTKTS